MEAGCGAHPSETGFLVGQYSFRHQRPDCEGYMVALALAGEGN